MKAEIILYSRTLNRDYRWIFLPSWIDSESIKKLKALYDLFDDDKSMFEKNFPPLISICLCHHWLIIYIVKTNYRDANGRYIFCMQGLCFSRKNWEAISYLLPYIVDNYKDVLSVYNFVDINDIDQIEYQSKEVKISFDSIEDNASKKLLQFEDYFYDNDGNISDINNSFSPEFFILLKYIYSERNSIKEFTLCDKGIGRKVLSDVKFFDSSAEEFSSKDEPLISKEDEGNASKIKHSVKESDANVDIHFEMCEIVLKENKNGEFTRIIKNAIKKIINETSNSVSRYGFVAMNTVNDHIFYVRELSADIAIKGRNKSDVKDENVIKFNAELDILVMKLISDGWQKIDVNNDIDKWWNYKFKRQIKGNQ